jgi:chromosome segregation ATPase
MSGAPKTLAEAAKAAREKVGREAQNTHLTNQFTVINSRMDALEKDWQGMLGKLGDLQHRMEDLEARQEALWTKAASLGMAMEAFLNGLRELVSPSEVVLAAVQKEPEES